MESDKERADRIATEGAHICRQKMLTAPLMVVLLCTTAIYSRFRGKA